MSTFYICCHCGYPRHNHNFRHEISEIKVYRVKNQSEERFSVDAKMFPLCKATRCAKGGCNGVIGIHGTTVLEHKYIPVEYSYRNIRMVLPVDSICNKCKIVISKHNSVMTHHFTTNVIIENLRDNDKIFIIDPEDEDRKIIFNS